MIGVEAGILVGVLRLEGFEDRSVGMSVNLANFAGSIGADGRMMDEARLCAESVESVIRRVSAPIVRPICR